MQIPDEFMPRVLSGELMRKGAILQHVASGRIVGHLKEVGQLGLELSKLPINPAMTLFGQGIDLANNIYQSVQMEKIQKALGVLQVTSGVGAVASVATLGVSVVGFSVISNQLSKMDSKLDIVACELHDVRKTLQHIDIKWESLTMGNLVSASERLMIGEDAVDLNRKTTLLNESNREFSRLRSYFFSFIKNLNLALNPSFTIMQVRDVFSRYYACAIGQLHSEFLLGDLNSYRKTLDLINGQLNSLADFDAIDLFRVRCDHGAPLDIYFDHQQLAEEVRSFVAYTKETVDRIESYDIELDYIERNGIKPVDYIEFLKEQESGLVFIPV